MAPALCVRRCILCQVSRCLSRCEVNPAACRVVLTVMVNSFAWLPSETALGQAVKPLLTQVYMQVGWVHPACPGIVSYFPSRACCLVHQFAKWVPTS